MTDAATIDLPAAESSPSAAPSIELHHLHRFFGKLKAVNDVSFRVYPGEVMGFIGPNGAGKTTAMRILATLDVPTAGDAYVGGYSVVDQPDEVRRAHLEPVEHVDSFLEQVLRKEGVNTPVAVLLGCSRRRP